MSKESVKNRAKMAAERAAEILTPAQNFAIAVAGKNIHVGSFWGFISLKEAKKYYDAIKDADDMNIRMMGDTMCIVEVNPDVIMNSMASVDPEAVPQKLIDKLNVNLQMAQVEFEKFMVNKGITDPNYRGVVAIYCTNQVTTLTYKNIGYPAFRLTLEHALSLMGNYGYQVRVNDEFMDVAQLAKDPDAWSALWNSMILAPTHTGVFIEIMATYQPAQYKEIRKQMKQAHV